MKRRTQLPILLAVLLVAFGLGWYLLQDYDNQSDISANTAPVTSSSGNESSESLEVPASQGQDDAVRLPALPPIEEDEERKPDDRKDSDPTIEAEMVERVDAPEHIRDAVDELEPGAAGALDSEGKLLKSKVVYTRKNHVHRFHGYLPKVSSYPASMGSGALKVATRAIRNDVLCPWPDAHSFLFGKLVDSKNIAKEPADKEEAKPTNWKDLGAIVTTDLGSMKHRGLVSATGWFVLPMDEKQRKNLGSASGLKVYVHCAGYKASGTSGGHQPVVLRGANQSHQIRVETSKALILELSLPKDHEYGGHVWVERTPDKRGVAWDDAIYVSAEVSPDSPTYIALPDSTGEIVLGGWGNDWRCDGTKKLRLKHLKFTKVVLAAMYCFIEIKQGTIVEDVDDEGEDIRSSYRARISSESMGVTFYSDRLGRFEVYEDISARDKRFCASFRDGKEYRFYTSTRQLLQRDGTLRIEFPLFFYDVEFGFEHSESQTVEFVVLGYSRLFEAKMDEERRMVVKWLPRMLGRLVVVNSSSKSAKRTYYECKSTVSHYENKPHRIKIKMSKLANHR